MISSFLCYSQDDKTKIATADKKTYKKSSSTVHPTTYDLVYDMLRMESGIIISGDSGFGSRPNIYIRGISTNSGNTDPLFVVDGTIVEDISYLQPSKVAQIEVLKDPTSSIYGIRGGNGVIMITTVTAKDAMEAEEQAHKEAKLEAKRAKQVAKAVRKMAK